MYSDGLVESRRRQLHDGIAQLETALLDVPGDATAGETAERVLDALAAAESEDDVALVVVRFRPDR
jgi:hypothetical protein